MSSTEASDALLRRAAAWLIEVAQHIPDDGRPRLARVQSCQEWKDGQKLYAILRARKQARKGVVRLEKR